MHTLTTTLKPGRDKAVLHGHPWIFSGAIASWSTPPRTSAVAEVYDADGTWLARGLVEGDGSLAIRIYTRRPDEPLDENFFARQLREALAWRTRDVFAHEPITDSFRLCFSEADGLSGLIIDRYRDGAVVHSEELLAPYRHVFDDVLREQGLNPTPTGSQAITESGFTYEISPGDGQKTGFYLDQRVNRRRVATYSAGRRALSCYCYTGGFEVHLAHAGAAAITGIDSSASAIEQAQHHHAMNPGGTAATYSTEDVPAYLRKCRDRRDTFDLIILDPPKFVNSQAQRDKGLRAYKDINRLAMKLLTPGGILATFSCSGWVKRTDFATAIAWAALDADRELQVLEHLGQPPDHPVRASFPEGDYLCGLIARCP